MATRRDPVCVACDIAGAQFHCTACGISMHTTCMPRRPGQARSARPVCPICSSESDAPAAGGPGVAGTAGLPGPGSTAGGASGVGSSSNGRRGASEGYQALTAMTECLASDIHNQSRTRYFGVSRAGGKWKSKIVINSVEHDLGRFTSDYEVAPSVPLSLLAVPSLVPHCLLLPHNRQGFGLQHDPRLIYCLVVRTRARTCVSVETTGCACIRSRVLAV